MSIHGSGLRFVAARSYGNYEQIEPGIWRAFFDAYGIEGNRKQDGSIAFVGPIPGLSKSEFEIVPDDKAWALLNRAKIQIDKIESKPQIYARIVDRDSTGSQHTLKHLSKLAFHLKKENQKKFNTCFPAAYSYFGQLLAHDLTHMKSTMDSREPDNISTHSLDLNSIIGAADTIATIPYHKCSLGACLGPTTGGRLEDIARSKSGIPTVSDKRNDANLIVSQMAVAIIKLYHRIADICGKQDDPKTQLKALQHIHSIVLHDWLPKLVGSTLLDDICTNGRQLVWRECDIDKPFHVPAEFAAACFRFGHSMIREQYLWNSALRLSIHEMIEFTHLGKIDGTPQFQYDFAVPQWRRLIEADEFQPAGLIDEILDNQLHTLPLKLLEPTEINYAQSLGLVDANNEFSLSELTLVRGKTLGLPSAQNLQSHFSLRTELLSSSQIADVEDCELKNLLLEPTQAGSLVENTPLWLYTLREAQILHCGKRLGPLAGRIVAETVHAAIAAVPGGILDPSVGPFTPLPGLNAESDERYTLHDLLINLAK